MEGITEWSVSAFFLLLNKWQWFFYIREVRLKIYFRYPLCLWRSWSCLDFFLFEDRCSSNLVITREIKINFFVRVYFQNLVSVFERIGRLMVYFTDLQLYSREYKLVTFMLRKKQRQFWNLHSNRSKNKKPEFGFSFPLSDDFKYPVSTRK